jgi:hypothetical protein
MRTLRIVFYLLTIFQYNFLFANISERPKPNSGNIIGTSAMRNISVLHEDLSINISDVVNNGLVHVNAIYKINCLKGIHLLDLVFVANNLTESRYRVNIDGEFTNGQLLPFDTIPHSWLPPDSILWNNKLIPYKYTYEGLISFRIDSLSVGEHTLEVSYDAEASSWFESEDLAQFRTLVYILRPSDTWENFGSININIFIPESWDFSSNLTFDRHDPHALHGYWKKLPADFLSIAIHKPTTKANIISLLFQVISWTILVILLIWWLSKVAKSTIAKKSKRIIHVTHCFFISLIISIAFYVIYFYKYDLLKLMLDDNLNPMVTYGKEYDIFGFPLVWIFAFILTLLIDYFNTRRLKHRNTE